MKFTMELNEAQEEVVTDLSRKLGVTKADLMRRSIKLLEVIVRETAEGKRSIRLVDPDGEKVVKELLMDMFTTK